MKCLSLTFGDSQGMHVKIYDSISSVDISIRIEFELFGNSENQRGEGCSMKEEWKMFLLETEVSVGYSELHRLCSGYSASSQEHLETMKGLK